MVVVFVPEILQISLHMQHKNVDELTVCKRNQISHLNVNSVNVTLIKAFEIPSSRFFTASLIIRKSFEPVLWC